MKSKFLKKSAATIMAVSVLSMGLVANAAQISTTPQENTQNDTAQKVYENLEWTWPVPAGEQVPYDQYLDALMDVVYRNDSQAFVALGLGTAEDATCLYNAVLDSELLGMELESILGIKCPETIENDLRALMIQLLGNARYAVTGCELQPDGTYKVTIIYEQMILFKPLMEQYLAAVSDLSRSWMANPASAPSEEDAMIQLLTALCSTLRTCLDNITYAAPTITTVTFELQNGAYLPNMDDIVNLETLLFDTNSILSQIE